MNVIDRVSEAVKKTQQGIFKICHTDVNKASRMIMDAKITLFFGNGGSHALASHIAADITKVSKGKALAVAPFDSVVGLTAWSNDDSYEYTMAQMLKPYTANLNDVCIFFISTSGLSENVMNGMTYTKKPIIFLTNAECEYEDDYPGLLVHLKEPDTRCAENINLAFCHMIVAEIEERFREKH